MQNRRDFIKQSCSLCAGVIGLGIVAAELESCKTTGGLNISVTQTQITFPITAFGEQKNYLVKDYRLPYDVLVVKKPDGTYTALQMRCTHRGTLLRLTPDKIVCDKHGSEFDFNGNVLHEPAPLPLTKYPCTVEKEIIVVHLDA
jgi:nitrite reductase/ring-hydroxylating ferredoxin subunit